MRESVSNMTLEEFEEAIRKEIASGRSPVESRHIFRKIISSCPKDEQHKLIMSNLLGEWFKKNEREILLALHDECESARLDRNIGKQLARLG